MLKTIMREEKKIIERFKNEIFPFYHDEEYEEQMRFERAEEEGKKKKKNKKKNQKKIIFSNIIKINQNVSAMICLEIILILKHLLS